MYDCTQQEQYPFYGKTLRQLKQASLIKKWLGFILNALLRILYGFGGKMHDLHVG